MKVINCNDKGSVLASIKLLPKPQGFPYYTLIDCVCNSRIHVYLKFTKNAKAECPRCGALIPVEAP